MMNNSQTREKVSTRRDRPRSSPPAGQDPQPDDGDTAGAVELDDLFGTPALDDSSSGAEADSPGDVWGDPEAEPNVIPPLRFTAFPPERAAYTAAFIAAYKYPHALQLVMSGIRKGLKRGKKAAEAAGESR